MLTCLGLWPYKNTHKIELTQPHAPHPPPPVKRGFWVEQVKQKIMKNPHTLELELINKIRERAEAALKNADDVLGIDPEAYEFWNVEAQKAFRVLRAARRDYPAEAELEKQIERAARRAVA